MVYSSLEVNQQNQKPKMKQSQENERDMPDEREEIDAETREMKEEILSQITNCMFLSCHVRV